MVDSNDKRIIKNTSLLYVRMILVMIVSLYSSRVILKNLGVIDFGIYNVVGSFVTMFSFLNGALSNAVSRYITYELGRKNFVRLKIVFRTSVTIHIIISIVVVIILETIGLWFLFNKLVVPVERMYAASWVFHFSVLMAVISIMQIPLTALVIAHEKMGVYAYLGIFEVLSKLLVAFSIGFIGKDNLIMFSLLVSFFTLCSFFILFIYVKLNFKECLFLPTTNKSMFKEMLFYSGWSFIGNLSGMLKMQGINILLNIFFGPVVNAARGIAFQVSMSMKKFVVNFTTALNPQIIKYYASNDISKMLVLVYRSTALSYYLLFILSLPVILETSYLLKLWLGDVPQYSIIFTKLIILDSLIDTLSYSLMTSIQATGKIKWYQVYVGGLLLLNLPISWLLLKLNFSPSSTLKVSILLSFVALFVRLYFIKRNIPEFNVRKFILKVIITVFMVSFLSSIVPIIVNMLLEESLMRFLIVILVSVLSCIFMILYIGITGKERKLLKKFITNKVNKIYGK